MSVIEEFVCCDGARPKSDSRDEGDLLNDEDQDLFSSPADAQQIPPSLREIIDNSLSIYKRLKDNAEWNLCAQRPGFKVFNAPYPGHQVMYWKVEVAAVKGTRERITAEMFDYRLRCAWDHAAVARGRILRHYQDGYMVVQWFTCPIGGGIITPREFQEARLISKCDDGSLYLTSPSIEDDVLKSLSIKPALSNVGSTRAITHPGNGFSLEPHVPVNDGEDPDGYRTFKLTLISCIDLGGWLPTSMVNMYTAQNLVDSTDKQLGRLNVVFAQ